MKAIDLKSILIGILITLLFLSVFGFRPETDELGHLVVKSITIEDDRGVVTVSYTHLTLPTTRCG